MLKRHTTLQLLSLPLAKGKSSHPSFFFSPGKALGHVVQLCGVGLHHGSLGPCAGHGGLLLILPLFLVNSGHLLETNTCVLFTEIITNKCIQRQTIITNNHPKKTYTNIYIYIYFYENNQKISAHPGTPKPNISPKTSAGNGYKEAEPVQIKALEGFKAPNWPGDWEDAQFFFSKSQCVFHIMILQYYRYIRIV